MRASPVQAKTIGFFAVSIEPRKLEDDEARGSNFEWDGVNIASRISTLDKPEGAEANLHLLVLEIEINDTVGRVFAPYNIKVSAWGAFEFRDTDTSEADALDLVVVNGASMLYGAIREMVSTLTARMPNRQLMLPTATFLDHKPSAKATASGDKRKPAKKAIAKKSSTSAT
ncbi:hypothetical protein [Achromobacter animicus]|uniref:hypothetical protein n=1 Tax=Achromobacter animicus TaxID=1389935 RepID=UPI0014682B3E|nr:hypothetical protein [Achromobacter animicus]CAB3850978.1 hypothetical protein LMG26691_01982 [Achromobacter animicus]